MKRMILAAVAAFAAAGVSGRGFVETCVACGEGVYFVENREGGGFRVRLGEGEEPLVVSESGVFDVSEDSPLRALAERCALRRAQADAEFAAANGGAVRKAMKTAGASEVSLDVRVGPLVRAQWQQKHMGVATQPAFNYYTPGNSACGCVAVAFAQIMHSWRWPRRFAGSLSPLRNWIYGSAAWLEPMGGEYDWDAMPLTIDDCRTEYQRQCCGRIAYDIAVCLGTDFRGDAGGAWADLSPAMLKKDFSYAFARSFDRVARLYATENKPLSLLPDYRNAILASLDGGMSCVVGVGSASGYQHEFVVDGYAVAPSGRIYCHVNFGWGGLSDAWYDLMGGETVVADGYGFNSFDDVIYNIHPSKAGDVISGRVLDSAGDPLGGVAVELLDKSGKSVDSAVTSTNGIYALRFTGKGAFTVRASAGTQGSGSAAVSVARAGENVNGRINDNGQPVITGYDTKTGAAGVVANVWGVDIVLGGNGGGGSGGDAYDATAGAAVFDGALRDKETLAVSGSVQAKVAKASKDGTAKVSATVVRADIAKKLSYKGVMDAAGDATLTCAGREPLQLHFGADGLSGACGGEAVSGARNLFQSKNKEEKAAADAALSSRLGAVNVKFDGGVASVVVQKSGKAKAAVTLSGGAKQSVSAQAFADGDDFAVAVVSPKTGVAFVLRLDAKGGAGVEGLDGGALAGRVAAPPQTLTFIFPGGAQAWADAGLPGETALLPDGFAFAAGAKWKFPKGDSVKLADGAVAVVKDNGNPSALKLAYKAADGTFKGSFKAYGLEKGKLKAWSVNVSGVMLGGEGHGTASIKNFPSIPVVLEQAAGD